MFKRDEMSFVNDQDKEALNFNISMTIYTMVAGLLIFVVIGIVLLPVVLIAWLVLTILAAVKANDGGAYRYPLTLLVN